MALEAKTTCVKIREALPEETIAPPIRSVGIASRISLGRGWQTGLEK